MEYSRSAPSHRESGPLVFGEKIGLSLVSSLDSVVSSLRVILGMSPDMLSSLPPELYSKILRDTSAITIVSLRQTCHLWNTKLDSNATTQLLNQWYSCTTSEELRNTFISLARTREFYMPSPKRCEWERPPRFTYDCIDELIDVIFLSKVNPSDIKFTATYTDAYGLVHRESGLLHAMAFREFKKRAQYLIDQGIDMNQRDTYGNTALHVACKSPNSEMFKFLVMHGADTKVKNDKGETPKGKPWW